MSLYILNHLVLPIFILFFLLAILGYGRLLDKYTNFYDETLRAYNIVLIQGLFLISVSSILINFLIPITDFVIIIFLLLGLYFYVYFLLKVKDKKKESKFLLIVTLLSFIFSYFAGVHDDYSYHISTIFNFKEKNLFQIIHERNISYNSNWLFINAVISFSYFSSTLYILTSIIYSIFIFDIYRIYKQSVKNKFYYSSLISYFVLIFFIGVLNNYKEHGTDIPGVILSFYLLIILSKYKLENVKNIEKNILLISFFLICFAFVIKITNVLLILFLIFVISLKKILNIEVKKYLLFSILPFLWIFQNYNISGCLVWPIEITCFTNNDKAIFETYLIESFAKGDINTTINVEGFTWINTWLNNHINKIAETYLLFFLIFFFPIIYNYLKSLKFRKSIFSYSFNIFTSKNYLVLFLIIILTNIIWFINAPAYRFGIFYNLSLIIFLLLPFWKYFFENHLDFTKKYLTTILILISIYFGYENFTKYSWYLERYSIWPPIENNLLISRN